MMSWMRPVGTYNSSATICMRPVCTPIPISTLPVKTRMVSSLPICSQLSRRPGAGVAGVSAAKSSGATPAPDRLNPTNSPPPVLRKSRREDMSGPPFHAGCALNGGSNLHVAAAAADQPAEGRAHLVSGGVRVRVEQGFGRQHPSVQAVAALEGLLFDEGLLHRMWMVGRTESFQ